MKLYLGVDGGQSSTTALAGDETGRVVGYGRGGPCNHISGPEARARFLNAIGGCVRAAAGAGDGEKPRFAAACFGFSGGAEDKQGLLDELLSSGKRLVTHDGLIALTGATAGEPGIIVVAGTGSFAFGRGASGRTVRAGGWGYIFGDEGSGFDIARQALRAALRMEEGWGAATTLRERLLEFSSSKDANEALHKFYKPEYPRQVVARFARQVDEAAREGDAVAAGILGSAAIHLAGFASSIRAQLFAEREPARVCWIGSVFRSDLLREKFRALVELTEGNRAGPPLWEPAAGALLEAYRLDGLHPELSNLPESEK